MTQPPARDDLTLAIGPFATWARVNRVALPYPLDISTVPGVREVPSSEPALQRLAAVSANPRVAVLYIRDRADGRVNRAVAVADTGSSAVVVRSDDTEVGIRVIADTELVRSIADLLPELAPLTGAVYETDAATWDRLMAIAGAAAGSAGSGVSAAKSERVLDAFADAEVPAPLAQAVVSTTGRRITTGVLGSLTWGAGADARQPRLGTHAAAWYEYETGGILVDRRDTRHGGAVVTVAPYRREAATRLLSALIVDTLRAVGPNAAG